MVTWTEKCSLHVSWMANISIFEFIVLWSWFLSLSLSLTLCVHVSLTSNRLDYLPLQLYLDFTSMRWALNCGLCRLTNRCNLFHSLPPNVVSKEVCPLNWNSLRACLCVCMCSLFSVIQFNESFSFIRIRTTKDWPLFLFSSYCCNRIDVSTYEKTYLHISCTQPSKENYTENILEKKKCNDWIWMQKFRTRSISLWAKLDEKEFLERKDPNTFLLALPWNTKIIISWKCKIILYINHKSGLKSHMNCECF